MTKKRSSPRDSSRKRRSTARTRAGAAADSSTRSHGPKRGRTGRGVVPRRSGRTGAPRRSSTAAANAAEFAAVRRVAPIRLTDEDRSALRDLLTQLLKSNELADASRKVERYLELLSEWNQRGNLLSRNDLTRVVERHVRESLACVPLLDELGARRVLDVGSGGGFPGVLIQIVRPSWQVVLLDSRRMKSLFLQQVVRSLPLENATVVNARVETFGAEGSAAEAIAADTEGAAQAQPAGGPIEPARPRNATFDVVTARAVAALAQLAEWAAPLLRSGGHLVTFKGSRLEEELRQWRHSPEIWESPTIVDTPIPHLRFVVVRRL